MDIFVFGFLLKEQGIKPCSSIASILKTLKLEFIRNRVLPYLPCASAKMCFSFCILKLCLPWFRIENRYDKKTLGLIKKKKAWVLLPISIQRPSTAHRMISCNSPRPWFLTLWMWKVNQWVWASCRSSYTIQKLSRFLNKDNMLKRYIYSVFEHISKSFSLKGRLFICKNSYFFAFSQK